MGKDPGNTTTATFGVDTEKLPSFYAADMAKKQVNASKAMNAFVDDYTAPPHNEKPQLKPKKLKAEFNSKRVRNASHALYSTNSDLSRTFVAPRANDKTFITSSTTPIPQASNLNFTIQRNANQAHGSLNPRAWRPSYDTREINDLIYV